MVFRGRRQELLHALVDADIVYFQSRALGHHADQVLPGAEAMVAARLLPMSCRSPRPVPISRTPTELVEPSLAVNSGFNPAMPAFMARAAISTDRKSTRLNSSHLGISYA